MLDFLPFGRNKKSADPLGSLKAATVWMQELPMGDAFSAHEKVIAALKEFNEQGQPATRDRLQILMHLDEGAQDLQSSLAQQYLRNPRMSRQIESRLWNALFAFNWELARGYHIFIMSYVAEPNKSDIRRDLALIIARAIRHFATQAKWRHFRYESVAGKAWKHLHNLYRLAEHEEFDGKALRLYAHCQHDSSCAREYLQLLALSALNTNSLFPRQIEMISGWLEGWSSLMGLDKAFDPERHVFSVALDEDKGPRRMRRQSGGEATRYWGTADLLAFLERTKEALRGGETAAKLGLGEDCKLPGCLELIDRIAGQWSAQGERVRRKHERVAKVTRIDVVKDFKELCGLVKHDNEALVPKLKEEEEKLQFTYDEMLDVRLYGFVTERTQTKLNQAAAAARPEPQVSYAHHERWLMENESAKGFGATVDTMNNDWVRLGKLVGLKPERSSLWVIGVVRRLSLLDSGQRNVGIEVLAQKPVAVTLRASKPRPSGYSVDGVDATDLVVPVNALYLPGNAEDKSGVSIILDSVEYAPGRHFQLSARSRAYSITLARVVEKGDDWLRASFDVERAKAPA